MANFFASLPAYRNSGELDFSPLNNAVQNFGETTRANAMAEYQAGRNKVADARAAAGESRAAERWSMEKDEYKRAQKDAAMKSLVGVVQLIDQEQDPVKRAQQWGKIRSSVRDFDADLQGLGVDPNDHINGPKFLIAKQRGLVEPKAPEVKEVNGRLVRVAPDGSSASEIYSAADQPGGAYANMKDRANVEESLRKEFATLAKPYFEVRDAYSRVQQSAVQPSAAGDLALIFNYMKMLDPGSVVREGEFATAQSAAGVPDRIWNLYNRILSGERLNPDQRKDFIGQAQGLFQRQEKQYQAIQKQYKGIGERTGVDTRNTILDFGRPPEETGALDAARDAIARGADRNAVIQRLQQNGVDPSGL